MQLDKDTLIVSLLVRVSPGTFHPLCFQIFESGVTFPLQDIRTVVVGKTFTSLIILTMTFQLKVLLKMKLFKRLIDVIFCLSISPLDTFVFFTAVPFVYADAVFFYCVLIMSKMSLCFSSRAVNVYICLSSLVFK